MAENVETEETVGLLEAADGNFDRLLDNEYALAMNLVIPDKALGVSKLVIQVSVLIVMVVACVVDERWFETERAVAGIRLKLEGTAYADLSDRDMSYLVADHLDLSVATSTQSSLFVATRTIQRRQQLTNNDGDDPLECVDFESRCPCQSGDPTVAGIATGQCSAGYCTVQGWCQKQGAEDSEATPESQIFYDAHFEGVDLADIVFDVNLDFPKFGFSKRLTSAHREHGVNFWKLGDLLEGVGTTLKEVRENGAIVLVNMHWHCEYPNHLAATKESETQAAEFSEEELGKLESALERFMYRFRWQMHAIQSSVSEMFSSAIATDTDTGTQAPSETQAESESDPCHLSYEFLRGDEPGSVQKRVVSNYSPAKKYELFTTVNVRESRDVSENIGVVLIVNVSGEMRRVSMAAFLGNVGALAGLMIVVPLLMDAILNRRHSKRWAKMKDSDIEVREKLHYDMIKRLLLSYLKGEEQF